MSNPPTPKTLPPECGTAGFILGTLVGGFLGDVWGRRNTLLFSGVLFIASAAASSFAPNLLWLMLLRTLVGFAVGFKATCPSHLQ